MVLEIHMKLCMTEPDFLECFFAPKIGKMDQKGPKQGFLSLLKTFVIRFY